MLDKPISGRIFFEQIIADNLYTSAAPTRSAWSSTGASCAKDPVPVRAEYSATLCDLGIFVNEPEPVAPDDLDVGIGGVGSMAGVRAFG
jgi:hypothetical protein